MSSMTETPRLLERLAIDPEQVIATPGRMLRQFGSAIGTPTHITRDTGRADLKRDRQVQGVARAKTARGVSRRASRRRERTAGNRHQAQSVGAEGLEFRPHRAGLVSRALPSALLQSQGGGEVSHHPVPGHDEFVALRAILRAARHRL